MHVDGPVEDDPAAEFRLQLIGIHAGRLRLDRLQCVHAARDKAGNQRPARAAAVVRYLGPVGVDHVEEFLFPRREQAVEAGWRDQRAALAAEVVSTEHQIDPAPSSLQDPLDVPEVETVPLLDDEQEHRVFRGDVEKHLLDAASHGHAVDEILHPESTRRNRPIRVLPAQGGNGVEVVDFRVRPGKRFRLGDGLPGRIGIVDGLGIGSVFVGHRPAQHSPDVHGRTVVEGRQRWTDVGRLDVANVGPQALSQRVVVGETEMVEQGLLDLRGREVVARGEIGGHVGQGSLHAFARSHTAILEQ